MGRARDIWTGCHHWSQRLSYTICISDFFVALKRLSSSTASQLTRVQKTLLGGACTLHPRLWKPLLVSLIVILLAWTLKTLLCNLYPKPWNLPLLTPLVPLLSCPHWSNSPGARFGVVSRRAKGKNLGLNQDNLLSFGFLLRSQEPRILRATSLLPQHLYLFLKHSLKSLRKKEKRASCLSRWASASILGMRDP